MFCVMCGARNPDYGRFCSRCGDPIPRAEAEIAPQAPRPFQSQTPSRVLPTPRPVDPAPAPPPRPESPAQSGEQQGALPAISREAEESRLATPAENAATPESFPTFRIRLSSYLADLIVFYFLSLLFGIFIGVFFPGHSDIFKGGFEMQVASVLAFNAYMALSLAFCHTTIGKYVCGLEVRSSIEGEAYPPFGRILLRETVGRDFSSLFFGIGYWNLSDHFKNQAWSDRMAHTYVSWRPVNRVLKNALSVFLVLAVLFGAGFYLWATIRSEKESKKQSQIAALKSANEAILASQNAINELLRGKPSGPVETKLIFSKVRSAADEMDRRIATGEAALRDAQNSGLLSAADRRAVPPMKELFRLRRELALTYRQEAEAVSAFDPARDDGNEFLRNLKSLDSDISRINGQIQVAAAKLNQ